MLEVFATNVLHATDAAKLETLLTRALPDCTFNFDLEDCDRIFRIISKEDVTEKVIALFRENDFSCSVLP